MNLNFSHVMGERLCARYIRLETGVSSDASNMEGSNARIDANDAGDTRQPTAPPSQSQQEDTERNVVWEIDNGVVWISPKNQEREEERQHKQEHLDEYLNLLMGDESRIC